MMALTPMAQTTLGDLLLTIQQEIAQTIDQTQDRTQDATTQTRLYVSDIDIDLPAYIRFDRSSDPNTNASHVTLDLPNLRETTSAGRLGRLRVTFAYDKTNNRA
jgi:hypothetical protein